MKLFLINPYANKYQVTKIIPLFNFGNIKYPKIGLY